MCGQKQLRVSIGTPLLIPSYNRLHALLEEGRTLAIAMGILFSRPGLDDPIAGVFPVGDPSSAESSSIQPYLGTNTGLYRDVSPNALPPIPFEWIVSPRDIDGASCPNGSNILAWFAATEGVITALTLIVAHRSFIHRLSCRFLGKRRSNSVWITWTIPFVCQLIANAIIAGVVGNTPGYGHLNKLHIFTAYMSRPRFYFVALAFLRALVSVKRPKELDKTTIIKRSRDNRFEFPYTDAWITTAVSELLLLIIGSIFTGVTWGRMPSASKAHEYIQDHVGYVSGAPGMMVLCMFVFIPVFKRYGDTFPVQGRYGEAAFRAQGRRYGAGRRWGAVVNRSGEASIAVKSEQKKKKDMLIKRTVSSVIGGVFLGFVCLIQWSYWTRFLEMPGVL